MVMKLKRKYIARYDESQKVGMNRRLKNRHEDLGDVSGSSVIEIIEKLVLVDDEGEYSYPRQRERVVKRYIFAADCLTLEELRCIGLAPPLAPAHVTGIEKTHLFVATAHREGYWPVRGKPHIFITRPDLKEQKRQEQLASVAKL